MVAASKLQVESMEGKWSKHVLGHDVEKDIETRLAALEKPAKSSITGQIAELRASTTNFDGEIG